MSVPNVFCYPIKVISVYDGDSLTAQVDVGFGWKKEKLKCRLYGIDTPEIRGSSDEEKEMARAAKQALWAMLENAGRVVMHSMTKPDKYGRCLVKLWADDIDVSQRMIELGHARAYDGGAKQPWV